MKFTTQIRTGLCLVGASMLVFAGAYAAAPSDPKDGGNAVATTTAAQPNVVLGDVVLWAERKPEAEPYPIRLLANKTHLRFDSGKDTDDFLLLERTDKTLYNVVHASKSVLRVEYVPVSVDEALSAAIKLGQELEDMPNAPTVEGVAPKKLTLRANDVVCREAVVVPGLLPEITLALEEFVSVMASFYAAGLPSAPKDKLSVCSFADSILAPNRRMAAGFPIQENEATGRQRVLYSIEEGAELPQALFSLPPEYAIETFAAR